MPVQYPCGICKKSVAKNHRAFRCKICSFWIHIKCNSLSSTSYDKLKTDNTTWTCIKCINENIPFSKSSDEILKLIMQGINVDNLNNLNPENSSNKNFFNQLNEINFVSNDNVNRCLYYTLSELNNIKQNKRSLSVFHLNVSSLGCHFDELHTLLANSKTKFDFIGISETGHKKSNSYIQNITLDGYNFIECTTESRKGRVGLFISKKHDFKPRPDLKIYKTKELESIFIEIPNKKGKNLVVGCIYRHPCMSITEFNENYLETTLEKLSLENKNIILLGDFNINLINYESNRETNEFVDLISSNSLIPHILKPTRITTHSKTLIDNIFSNFIEIPVLAGNITCSISDHLAQFAILDLKTSNLKKPIYNYKRDFTKFNRDDFILDFLAVDWEKILNIQNNDPDKNMNILINTTNKIIEKHAPLIKYTKKSKAKKKKLYVCGYVLKKIRVGR